MSKPEATKVISGTSQTAYERYELPNVKTIQQQKQEKAGMLTARQLEALQKQAYDEGFQQGKEEGYQAGFQQAQEAGRQQGLLDGQQEVAQIVLRFEQIMKFLAQPLEKMNQCVEEELFSLSMATAKQIIRREIQADPGQIVAVIKEAIHALPSGTNKIKVYLHPADAQIARESLKLSQTTEDDEQLWTIIEEPILTRGGCQIETESSQIDASIETRLAEIAAQIMGSERTNIRDEAECASDVEAITSHTPVSDSDQSLSSELNDSSQSDENDEL